MAYIENVALKMAGSVLSRTVTDMWRASVAQITFDELDERVEQEIQDRIGTARDSTRTELREAVDRELLMIAQRSGVVTVSSQGLSTCPPGRSDGPHVIRNKEEMHRFLVQLSSAVSLRRREQRHSA